MTAPETLDGWFALHEMRRLDRRAWHALDESEREKASTEATGLLAAAEAVEDAAAGRSITYWVIGHKADLLTIHLRPETSQLQVLERRFDQALIASYTEKVFSYLSVVEISRHGLPEGGIGNVETSPYIQSRLYPEIPEYSSHVCFYPMSKRREEDNWYLLDAAERGQLMRAHGQTGRRYAGEVGQIVTGSIGLDDWEWGVTLFADDPLLFKKLIYEMRFDEVSARYAEFGPFYVGRRVLPSDLGEWLQ